MGVDFSFDLHALAEVDEQCHLDTRHLEIVKKFLFKKLFEGVDGFKFYDHLVFHEQIDSEVADWFSTLVYA